MKLFIGLLIVVALWQIVDPDLRLSPKEVILRKTPPMNVPYENTQAYTYLNEIRTKMGMNKFDTNDVLSKAALAHAEYLVINNESTHIEIEGHRKFVAAKPVERALHFGYDALMTSENVSTKHHSAKESVNGLFSAIYHRFGFLSTTMNEVGIGIKQDEFDSDKSAFVYLMGNSDVNQLCNGNSFTGQGMYVKGCKDSEHRIAQKDFLRVTNYSKQTNPDIVVYPYNEQREVPPVFYAESPDPLPSYDVSGFPISVEFNDYFYKDVTLLSFNLYDNDGASIESQPMDMENDPNMSFTSHQFAIFPLKRLEYNALYHAEIVYSTNGKKKKKSWSFYTTRIQDEFYKVEKLYDELEIEADKSYVIYFKPVDEHDLLTDLQFPEEVDIQFLDHNTIKLTLIPAMSNELEEFILNTGTKKLHLTVKR